MGLAVLVSLVTGLAALVVIALIAAVRSQLRLRNSFEWPPGDDEPRREQALVPVGPPRKPLSEGAIALPLPDPEPETVEAYGREVPDDGDSDVESLAS